MRWTPSIVPDGMDQNFYFVVDRLDRDTIIFHETSVDHADLETVIKDLSDGQYDDPQRVIAFNPSEKWSGDVSEDLARELQRRADAAYEDLSSSVQAFVDRYLGRDRPRQLASRRCQAEKLQRLDRYAGANRFFSKSDEIAG